MPKHIELMCTGTYTSPEYMYISVRKEEKNTSVIQRGLIADAKEVRRQQCGSTFGEVPPITGQLDGFFVSLILEHNNLLHEAVNSLQARDIT
jgi:hypothetical protein